MIKKHSEIIKERLQNVMANDRINGIENLLVMLKFDLLRLLESYVVTDKERVEIMLDVCPDSTYELNIKVKAEQLIKVGKMI